MALLNILGGREPSLNSWATRLFRFPFRFWDFLGSLALRMSLYYGWGSGNSALTISLDFLTLGRILSFISHILTLWEHCYSVTNQSLLGHNSLIPWFIPCISLTCRQLWPAPTPNPSIIPLCCVLATMMGMKDTQSLLSFCIWGVCESMTHIREPPFLGSGFVLSRRGGDMKDDLGQGLNFCDHMSSWRAWGFFQRAY